MTEPLGGYGPDHINPPEDWSCDECYERPGNVWLDTGNGRQWICHGCQDGLEEAGLIVETPEEET